MTAQKGPGENARARELIGCEGRQDFFAVRSPFSSQPEIPPE